ncbi:MAG: preprotein translocase subunit SecG [Actinomycetota bacterium]|nr:preprotein translocase subunit SecG [Actinomycetota bacterium]
MGTIKIAVLVLHIIVSIMLIVSVLLHSGKGSGLAGGILGGAGGTMFSGTHIVEKNLDRITIISGIIFALTSIGLVWLYS